jgi:fucose 4-O-acetylase-like acetyltransferase
VSDSRPSSQVPATRSDGARRSDHARPGGDEQDGPPTSHGELDEGPGEVTAWGYRIYGGDEPEPPRTQERPHPYGAAYERPSTREPQQPYGWGTEAPDPFEQPPALGRRRGPEQNGGHSAPRDGEHLPPQGDPYGGTGPQGEARATRWGDQSAPSASTWEHARTERIAPPPQPAWPGAAYEQGSGPSIWDRPGAPGSGSGTSFWDPPPATAVPEAPERAPSFWDRHERDEPPAAWGQHGDQDRPGGQGGPSDPQDRTAQQAERPAGKKREPYLDNVKFVLIALVIAGHSLVPTLAADSARSIYVFVYTFHMPAFVLISGYLSRNFWHSNAKINKLVDTLLIPYAVVEVGYALLRFSLGQKWSLTIIDPAWLNWYLLALVLWRISTPIWTRMRQPLLIAVALYLIAGFSEISGDFSIDRFFGLLPFYVLGLLLKPEHFDYLNQQWVKIAAVLTLAGGAVVAILIAPGLSLKPFYYKHSYDSMGVDWWVGLGIRGSLLIAALALTAAVLALVPRRETWFSDLGTRTLYAYLLHGIPVLIAKDQGWLGASWLFGPLGALAIMCSSVALAIVLCLPETRAIFRWVLEPRLTWLYRRDQARPNGSAAVAAPAVPAPATEAPAPAQPGTHRT